MAIIHDHFSNHADRVEAFERILNTYFSLSLNFNGYSVRHPPFSQYAAMLLNQAHWRERFGKDFPDAYGILLK